MSVLIGTDVVIDHLRGIDKAMEFRQLRAARRERAYRPVGERLA